MQQQHLRTVYVLRLPGQGLAVKGPHPGVEHQLNVDFLEEQTLRVLTTLDGAPLQFSPRREETITFGFESFAAIRYEGLVFTTDRLTYALFRCRLTRFVEVRKTELDWGVSAVQDMPPDRVKIHRFLSEGEALFLQNDNYPASTGTLKLVRIMEDNSLILSYDGEVDADAYLQGDQLEIELAPQYEQKLLVIPAYCTVLVMGTLVRSIVGPKAAYLICGVTYNTTMVIKYDA